MSLEQWETYYRQGALATCPTSNDGGYDQEVREAWAQFFAGVPTGGRILDVGTGNGAIALIAKETAAVLGRDWQVDATDLAQIDPMRDVADGHRRLSGIQFHKGVATEHLPFDSGSFDAVSGHYALEYTDTAAALAEIFRVLKPGGSSHFVIHHANSALVSSARWSLQESDFILQKTKVYRRLHRLVTMEAAATTAATERASSQLRAAIQGLKQTLLEARQVGAGDILAITLDAVQKLLALRTQSDPRTVGTEVDQVEAQLRASVRRLNDLVGHARTETDMAALASEATEAGFERVGVMQQYHAGTNLVGWRLALFRP